MQYAIYFQKQHGRKSIAPGKVIISCILLVLLFMTAAAHAESDQEFMIAQAGEIGEEMLLFQDIPSVYSASKYEQKVTEAPSSVSIVTADEIKKYGYRTLADIMRSVRGFYTSYDRLYDYLGVRGFLRSGDYNTRILLLIDGMRTNDAIYDTTSFGHEAVLDVDLIDRVEIVRGPGSSLYGTNAFFAVVNVITKDGRGIKGFEVSGEAGDQEHLKGRLTYGNRFDTGLEVLFSGTYFESEGEDRLFFKEYDDPTTNNGIAEDVDDQDAYQLFGEVSLGDFTLQGAYNEREKIDPSAQFFTDFNDPSNVNTDGLAYVTLTFDRLLPSDIGLFARGTYNYYWYDGDFVYSGTPNRDESRGAWLGLEINLTKRLFDKHTFLFGGEYRNNIQQDQRNFDVLDPPDVFLDDKRNSDYYAFFIQDEFKVTGWFTIFGGIRYDDYDTFGDTTNPRVALIFTPRKKSTIKLVYGEAFRAPNAYEFYYNDGPDFLAANPNLKPETIETYEVIFEQFIGNHVWGTVTGYYYEIENLISQTDHPTLINSDGDPTLFFDNIDRIEAYGFEAELEGKWESGVSGRVSYAYQDNENKTTGEFLSNSPKHMAKLNLILPVIKEKVFAGGELQYLDSRKTKPGFIEDPQAGSFVIANMTLFSKSLLTGLDISGSVYNLFDKRYSDPATEEQEQDLIELDGRTFRVKLTYTF